MSDYKIEVTQSERQVSVIESGNTVTISSSGVTGAGVAAGGTTGQLLAKNSNADYDTEWVDAPNSAVWGLITGTLSDQTDLQNALDAKENLANKATDLLSPDNTKYPTTLAVANAIGAITFPVTSVFGRTGNVTAQSGDYTTAQVTESGNLYFTNARAIGSTLTGFTAGSGTVSASDTILQAIQKLAGNDGLYVLKAGDTMTGTLVVPTLRAQSSAGLQLQNSGGTTILDLGAGGGVNATITAPLNVTGVSTSGVATALTVIGGTGTSAGGLRLGAWNANYGGIWSNNVTPSSTNYTLVSNGSDTALNTTSSGGLYVNNSTALGWNLNGVAIGAGAASLGQLVTISQNASRLALMVRGASSQTADLTQWQNSAGTVLASMTASGKLGIGTTSPAVKLEVSDSSGNEQLRVTYDATHYWKIKSASDGGLSFTPNSGTGFTWDTTGSLYALGLANSSTGSNASVRTLAAGTVISRNIADSNPALIVNQASSGAASTGDLLILQFNSTSKVVVNYNGNVGIGTTSPQGRLDVSAGGATQTAGDLVVDSANNLVYVGRLDSVSGNTNMIFRDRLGQVKSRWENASSGSIGFGNFGDGFGVRITKSLISGSIGSIGALLFVNNDATTATPSVIFRAHSAQTTDQLQIQNSAGTVLASVSSDGSITAPNYIGNGTLTTFAATPTLANLNVPSARNGVVTSTADIRPISGTDSMYKVAMGGNGATAMSAGNSAGLIVVKPPYVATAATGTHALVANFVVKSFLGTAGTVVGNGATITNASSLYIEGAPTFTAGSTGTITNAYGAFINTGATTSIGLAIQGQASQTADLQRWQNSAGTVLSSIGSDGRLNVRSDYASGAVTLIDFAGNRATLKIDASANFEWDTSSSRNTMIRSGAVTTISFGSNSSGNRVGIGVDTTDASAQLQINSTTRGFLPPRMTTTQRNAISSPAQGLQIFNTTTAKTETYDGTTWQAHW